jgi:hypothetical protein
MLVSGRFSPLRCLVGLLVGPLIGLLLSSSACASIPVKVRIEGSAKTLFEGPVSTEAVIDPPGISTPSSGGAHPCDVKDNGSNGGFGTAAATPTTALYDVAVAHGLTFDASWSKSFTDFFVSQVGTDVNGGAPEFPSWGYAVNYTTAGVGGCQFQLAPGSEVLWAYNYFNLTHLLSLSGPAAVNSGAPFAVHVSDGQTGEPISGAALGEVSGEVTTTIPSSPTTDANGNATIVLGHVGAVTLKATRSDAVRSNGLAVCVHNGNDGNCGTTVPGGGSPVTTDTQTSTHVTTSAIAKVAGVKNGRVYRRRSAPRILSGVVELSGGDTVRQVHIRLERRHAGHCFGFNGSSARFVRLRRCGAASFFSVGEALSFSYLLPSRLSAGRYVYEIQALDGAGHPTQIVSGVSRVVFYVR